MNFTLVNNETNETKDFNTYDEAEKFAKDNGFKHYEIKAGKLKATFGGNFGGFGDGITTISFC